MIRRCLLDLDGVIADFHTAWYTLNFQHLRPDPWPTGVWSLAEIHEISWKESCANLDEQFWDSIPWMFDGRGVLSLLEEHFGPKNICILTSNFVDDASVAAYGKVRWIEREIPQYKNRYFIGADKSFLAHKDVVLIDDKTENVKEFGDAGGMAFLLPRPWNANFCWANRTLYALELFLDNLRTAQ